MWIRLLLLGALCASFAYAEDEINTNRESLGQIQEPQRTRFDLDVTLDLQTRQSRIRRGGANAKSGAVRELSLGLGFEPVENLDFYFEGSAEEFAGDAEFFVKQAFLDAHVLNSYVSFRAGQFFYPVGWLAQEDNYFLRQPVYHEDLFKGDKALDLGAQVSLRPFQSEKLTLEASCFEGRIFRVTDQRAERAEERPCAFTARTQLEYFEAYLTHFEHHLAFFDPISANGAGIKLSSPPNWIVRPALWAEHWRIESEQNAGPTTLIQGSFFYPFVDWWRFRLGYRLAPATRSNSYATLGKVTSRFSDDLLRAEVRLFDPLRLVFEDQKVKQKGGITLEDEWSIRLLFELERNVF